MVPMTSLQRRLARAALLACPLLGGCAQGPRVRALTAEVAALREKYEDALQRQEELENRILLLSDQLESQRVAGVRRSAVDLPVVSLRPEAAPLPGQPTVVEFSGAARSDEPERVRPLLRAEGDSFAAALPGGAAEPAPRAEGRRAPGPVVRRQRAPQAPAAPLSLGPAGGHDNLGVVPVPRLPGRTGPPGTAQAAAAAPRTAPAQKATATAPAGEEPMSLYRTAYDHLRSGRYGEAERDLREFVRRFPRHDYADNAQYWLGETFYARRTYSEAATSFRAVVERWPTANKAPDALLKLGFSLLMMGDLQKGRSVLAQVTRHYPNTEAARLAERRLSELKDGK